MTYSAGCTCTAKHSPSTYVPNAHHILPQSWGGQTVPANLATVCNNAHMSIHALIDLHVHLNRIPTRAEIVARLGRYPVPLIRDLAAKAWAQRPAKPTPTSLRSWGAT